MGVVASCDGETPAVVRVGDGIPLSSDDTGGRTMIATFFDSTSVPRIEIAAWSLATSTTGDTEVAQAEAFARDTSLIAVVGHAGSKLTLLAAPVYREAGIPLIVPTSTARALRDAGPNIFMLAPPDDAIGAFLVDRALDSLGAQRLGLVYIADPYGEGIRAGVQQRLSARGGGLAGEVAMTGLECEIDQMAGRAVTRAFMRRVRADVVIVALPQALGRCVINEAVSEDSTVTIVATDSFSPPGPDNPMTPAEVAAVLHLVFWRPGPDSLSRLLVDRSRARRSADPTPSIALTLDAFLLVEAAMREGYNTREGLSRWLRRLGTAGHPPMQGVTGAIAFTGPRTTALHLVPLAESVRQR